MRKEWGQSSSATSGITAYSMEGGVQTCTMPDGTSGWRKGSQGKCYSTKEEAVKAPLHKGDVYMNGPSMFAALTKVDEENRLVYGVLADETPDRADEIFDYDKSKPYFQKWSDEVRKDTNGQSVGNLRAMHGKVAAGKFTELNFNDREKRVEVVAKVVDDNEWKKVLEGVYTGFSIGGSYVGAPSVEKVNGKEMKRYVANPTEGSLVDRPCNPTAKIFEVRKLDGSTEQRIFKGALPPEPTQHEVVGTDEDIAELAKVMGEAQLTTSDLLGEARALALRKRAKAEASEIEKAFNDDGHAEGEGASHGDAAEYNAEEDAAGKMPAVSPQDKSRDTAKQKSGLGAAGGTADGWEEDKRMTDTSDHKTENDTGVSHADGPDKTAAAKSGDLKKSANQRSARLREYGVVKPGHISGLVENFTKWAGEGFEDCLKVLSTKKDIENPEALGAWLYHEAKGEWPSERKAEKAAGLMVSDLEKIASHAQGILVKAGVVRPQLFKGMYSVGNLANLIDQVAWLRTSCDSEATFEKDERDAAMARRLEKVLEEMVSILKAMVEDEGSELINPQTNKALDLNDLAKLAYTPKVLRSILGPVMEKSGKRNSAADFQRITEIHEVVKGMGVECDGSINAMKFYAGTGGEPPLTKAGRTHSAATIEKMGRIHTLCKELGVDCKPPEKSAALGDLSKAITGDPGTLRSIIEKATQEATKELVEKVGELSTRLKKYEDAPEKPRGVLRAVSKEQDGGGLEKTDSGPQIQPIKTGAGDELDAAATLVKAVHAGAGSPLIKR